WTRAWSEVLRAAGACLRVHRSLVPTLILAGRGGRRFRRGLRALRFGLGYSRAKRLLGHWGPTHYARPAVERKHWNTPLRGCAVNVGDMSSAWVTDGWRRRAPE